jgi:hypothetical protein
MMKYVCIGGEVISQADGDRHYVNADKLMRLYGLNPNICDRVEAKDAVWYWRQFNPDSAYGRPIALRPRYDGRYDLLDNF